MPARKLLPLILIATPIALQAINIPVPNHSFEQPAVFGQQATGWTSNAGAISGGVNPYNVSGGFTAADEGIWFHYLNLPGFGGVNPSVTESNSGLIGTAATGTYTLTVAGGHRSNGATTNGSYVIELLAGGTVIASQTLNNPQGNIPVGSWQDITAVGVVNSGDPANGQDLTIRLSATSGTSGQQGQFDNVRLDYLPGFHADGMQILLGGQPFEVKGMCYQPAAIGENPSTEYPNGDYYFIRAGYDYHDRWARDFDNFRKLGINVIRLYGWDPTQNHDAFFQLAEENGIYVLINRWVNENSNWNDPAVVAALEQEWRNIAAPLANQPAVMGFLVGNEVNAKFNSFFPGLQNRQVQKFWDTMDQVAAAVKEEAPNKLVSVAITDDIPSVSAQKNVMTAIDFWGMQIYRGETFGILFEQFDAASDIPLIITEFGHDAYNTTTSAEFANDAAYPADIMEIYWNEIRQNSAIAAGGCVFSYSDEWWKDTDGTNGAHDTGGWENLNYIDGFVSEEWWGIFRTVDDPGAGNLDILEPRAMFYRLAAMWNDPYDLFPQAGAVGQNLQVDFFYPNHLKEQAITVESSYDLANWSTVAKNGGGSAPVLPLVDSLDVSLTGVGDDVLVSLLHAADAPPGEIPNLLLNGGFETGTAVGWLTDRGASDAEAQSGTYSLELTAAGVFTVPTAYQALPASPNDEFNLSGYILTPAALPANTTYGLLKIVFMDSGDTPLAPASVSPGMGTLVTGEFAGAESQPLLNSSSSVGSWVFSQVQAVAPAGTVEVQFFAINVDESPNTMYFDSIEAIDVNADPAPSGPNIFFRVTNNGR